MQVSVSELDRALKLISVARDRLMWDHAGEHDDIELWDKIEAAVRVTFDVQGAVPIEALVSEEELLDPLDPKGLTFVSFRPSVHDANWRVRVIHQPTGLSADAFGSDMHTCREAALGRLREKLQ